MSDEKLLHGEITEKVLKAFYHVYNSLGEGFLEKVYENAMVVALKKLGVDAVQQMPVIVYFKNEPVGEYFADLLVGGSVIVELKALESLAKAHEAQLTNYLRATRFEVGLLLNFGEKPDFRRKAYSNSRKKNLEQNPLQ